MGVSSVSAGEAVRELAEQRLEGLKVSLKVKYPHALVEYLVWHEEFGKFAVHIECQRCGSDETEVFTSDLYQCRLCPSCQQLVRVEKRVGKSRLLWLARGVLRAECLG